MRKIWQVFSQKQNSIGGAAGVLIVMVTASRFLGLLRDRMLASRFAPEELGVYFAAFRLPNLLFELLVMGVLTSAFIPVFTKYVAQKHEESWKMAAILINLTTLFLFLLSVPLFIWTKELSHFLAPGFSPSQIEKMVLFTRIMIVFQVLPLLIGNFFTGMLQSYNMFLAPALAPVLYNIGIIIGIIFLTPSMGLLGPVVGVGLGAALFMLIQLPLVIALGYRHSFSFSYKHSGVREVGRLMGPRTFGLAVSQIDSTVDLMLASLLGARMVTIFNFAQHLQQLPVGLFGATIAQASLPMLSVSSVKQDIEQYKKTIISSLHQITFFVLPISTLFIVLRIPIVRLVFGAHRFDWQATVLTGTTLSLFSISLFAQSMVHVLARGFYALYDSRTPVKIGIIAIIINTFLSVMFIRVWQMPVWSLGLSTSIASIINAFFLLVWLDKRVGMFQRRDLLSPQIKMFIAAIITGFALYFPLKLLDQLVFDTTRTFGLILLTGITSTIGMSTYLFLCWVFGVGQVQSFFRLLERVKKHRGVFLEPATEVINGGRDNLS